MRRRRKDDRVRRRDRQHPADHEVPEDEVQPARDEEAGKVAGAVPSDREDALADLAPGLATLRQRLADAEQARRREERRRAAAERTADEASRTLELVLARIRDLRAEGDALREQQVAAEQRADRIAAAREEDFAARLAQEKELTAAQQAAEQEAGALREEVARLADEVSGLREEGEAVRQERDALREEGEAVRQERDALREEGDALRQEGDALREEVERLGEEGDALRREIDQLGEEASGLREELGRRERESEELRGVVARVTDEAESVRRELAAAEQQAEQRRTEIGQLTAELDRRREQQRRLTLLLDQANRELAEADRERERYERQLGAIAASRSWRVGYGMIRALRLITFRRGSGADFARLGSEPAGLLDAGEARSDRAETVPAELLAADEPVAVPPEEAEVVHPPEEPEAHEEPAPPAAAPEPPILAMPSDDPPRVEHEDGHPASVDVIVCVRDAPDDVRRCLASVVENTDPDARLIVVDDGSADETKEMLERFAAQHISTTLIRNPAEPHGWAVAANIGLDVSHAEWSVVLNSDTVVTAGWLERLLATGGSDDAIGIVGPLSNAASHQSVPGYPEERADEVAWVPPEGWALLVRLVSPARRPRVPLVNGFCYAIRREVRESVGRFDAEAFPDGYGAEDDYSLRAAEHGWQLALADDVYVHHAKSRSYTSAGRLERVRGARRALAEKHGESEVAARVAAMEGLESMAELRGALQAALGDLAGLRETIAGTGPLSVGLLVDERHDVLSRATESAMTSAAGLRAVGVEARAIVPDPLAERVAELYPGDEALWTTHGDAAPPDVLVDVGPVAHGLRDALGFGASLRAALVHDRVSGAAIFGDHANGGPPPVVYSRSRRVVVELLASGVPARHVEPGIDLALYAAGREGLEADGLRIVVALEEDPTRAAEAFAAVAAASREADARLAVFGCDHDLVPRVAGGDLRRLGRLSPAQRADLLRRTDIVVDLTEPAASALHGLHAVAAGCATIVGRDGVPAECLVVGEEALAADAQDPQDVRAVLERLLADAETRRRLAAAASQAAQRFRLERAGLSEYALLHATAARVAVAQPA